MFSVALLWQVVMTTIGTVIALNNSTASVGQAFTSHMTHWDGGWYQHILTYGYTPEGSPAAPAFYPLFPLLIGVLSFISFGLIDPALLALLVNTVALWLTLMALLQIVRNFTSSTAAIKFGIVLFLCFPSAFFMHVFYGEAVFIAIGFWAYVLALRQRWWAMGILLAILSAARLPAVLFIVLCLMEYLRAHDWNLKKAFNPQILWFLLAPIGFLAYGTYLAIVRHDFFAMFHAYSATADWTYQIFSPNIFATISTSISTSIGSVAAHRFTYEIFINQLVPLMALAGLIVSSIICFRLPKKGAVPLGIFGLLSAIMFTLNSNLVSVHRYVLPCVVIYVVATSLYRRGGRAVVLWILAAACLILQLFLYTKFVSGIFAG